MIQLKNIRAEMSRNDINQTQLAELVGISFRTFNLKLNGYRKFTAEELFKISIILKVDINIFLKRV